MTQQFQPLPALHTSTRLMEWGVIVAVTLGIVSMWFFSEPLPQNLLYHAFADQRSLFGMPHTLNVLSNVVFCLAGIWGFALIATRANKLSSIDVIYLVFFIGILFAGLGSAYYHWSPNNTTLVWDRLPMTIVFMAFTAVVVFERYSESLGYKLFPWLLVVGVLSVAYWDWQDDLRPYIVVQFGPMLILPLIIWRLSGPGTVWLWLTVILYVAAKIVELSDHQIYQLTEGLVSGHSVKHLIAAIGAFMMVAKVRVQDGNKAT